MPDLPYLKLYVQDFLGDGKVRLMSPTEVGIYFLLLCHEWLEGPLPNEPERLARIAGASEEEMDSAWPQVRPCFEETEDGRLVQPRLEEEREKALDKREKARKAARARWGGSDDDASGGADAMHPHSERNADARSVADAHHSHSQKYNNTQGASGRNADADASASSEEDFADRVWPIYLEELGGNGRQPSLTDKRRRKLNRLGEEQLKGEEDPEEVFRRILRTVRASDHHMSQRSYQMPESLFRNEDRRERWTMEALDGGPPRERPDGREELAALREAADE